MIQCKEILENRSPDFALIKRPFEVYEKGRRRRRSSRVTIFRHSFMPYETRIHTSAPSFRADGAGNKMREEKLKNKRIQEREREHEREREETPKRETR